MLKRFLSSAFMLGAVLSLALLPCGCSGNHDGHDHHEHEGEEHEHYHSDHEGGVHEGDDHESEGHDHESEAHDHDHDGEIVIAQADAQKFGIETEKLMLTPFSEVVKTVGEILPGASDRGVVSAPTAGIIRLSSGIELGSKVGAGSLIATITSKNMSGGDPNAAAKVSMDAAKRELDRLEPLMKDGLITKREYNEALRAYEEARSAYSPSAGTGRAVSPIAGVISELFVNDGAFVEAGQPVAVIGRTTRLTLKALLPAAEVGFLPRVATANFKLSKGGAVVSLADRKGSIQSSSPVGSSATPGYLPVYFTFDSYGDVVPGSPVEVYLIGSSKSDALTVPLTAISEQQGEKFVYVRIEDDAYAKHPVTTGLSDGSRIEILSGIEPGEEVVVKGTTFVRLAETSTVVPEGHTHNH